MYSKYKNLWYLYKAIANNVEERFYISNYEVLSKSKHVINDWMNDKTIEIGMKILDQDHGKYITTHKLKKLMSEKFAGRFAKADINAFGEMADFDNKLKI